MCSVLILPCSSSLFSQTGSRFVSLYKYDQSNGLSSPNIRKICKDKFGFIWVATQDGLNKFDGKSFVVYNSNEVNKNNETAGSDFHDLILREHYLYAITSEGGLNIIDIIKNKVIRKLSFSSYIKPGDFLRSILFCKTDLLLVTSKGQLLFFDPSTNRIRKTEQPYNDNSALTINKAIILDGVLWLFTFNNGILAYHVKDAGIRNEISLVKNNSAYSTILSVSDFLLSRDSSKILVACNEGVLSIDRNTYNVDHWLQTDKIQNSNKPSPRLLCMVWLKDDLLVATTAGLFLYPAGLRYAIRLNTVNPSENKQWLQHIQRLFSDGEYVFAGNQTGLGLISNIKNPYVPFTRSSADFNVKIGHAAHLASLNDSIVYSCAFEKTLYKVNILTSDIKIVDSGRTYYQVIPLHSGRTLLSGEDKMWMMEQGRITEASSVHKDMHKIDGDFITASLVYNDSLIFLASQNNKGIYLYNPKAGKIEILDNSSKSMTVNDLAINNFYINSKKEVLTISDGSITVLNMQEGKSTVYLLKNTKDSRPLKIIMDGIEIGDNYYFAVYGQGVVVTDIGFNVKKIISANEGILNTGIYKIFKLTDTSFICSTNNGLFIYNIAARHARRISTTEGLQSNNFEEASGEKYKNRIVFGGENGFTVVYPENISRNLKPPLVYFTKIRNQIASNKLSDTVDLVSTYYQIANNVIQSDIYFSGINYSNPEQTTFSYRILEQSKEWINLNAQGYVSLIGLNPGTYHIQVKAANEDGVWSEPKELILVFLPKWYQTWWFYLLIALTVVGILYALYRYRITQIKKQHEIRKNIATDLHDDLGSTLNSVKVFTNLAISGVKQEESLQQVKDNLTEATTSLRDMIWVLDDSLDTVDELVTRLKQFAIPVAAASNIEAVIKADSEVNNRQLTKEEKRNLFLICKEAINNSIKYSGASRIDVAITAAGKKIQIVVADNGKGFNVDKVKKGYGLKNMQYRAGQIKYKVVFTSSPGNGTQIITLPL